MEKPELLWASRRAKDVLRRQNMNVEFVPSTPENPAALEEHMAQTLNNEEPEPEPEPGITADDSSTNHQPQATAEKPYNPRHPS